MGGTLGEKGGTESRDVGSLLTNAWHDGDFFFKM